MKKKNRKDWLNGVIDGVLFVVFAGIAWVAKNSGPYLEGYRLASIHNLYSFTIGIIKCWVGLAPIAFLFIVGKPKLKWNAERGFQLVCILFGFSYLYLAAARNVAGYLLLPANFSFFLCASSIGYEILKEQKFVFWQKTVFATLFIFSLIISSYRYQRFVRGINEPAVALRGLFQTSVPRLVFINGGEAAAQGSILAQQAQAPVILEAIDANASELAKKFIQESKGQVIVFELTAYNSGIPQTVLKSIESSLGGWKSVEDWGVYKLFYGPSAGRSDS